MQPAIYLMTMPNLIFHHILKKMKTKGILLLMFAILIINPCTMAQKGTGNATLKIKGALFYLSSIDSIPVEKAANKQMLAAGRHRLTFLCLTRNDLPLSSNPAVGTFNYDLNYTTVEFQADLNKTYVANRVCRNYIDPAKKKVIFNNNDFVAITEEKSDRNIAADIDTNIVFFKGKRDSKGYTGFFCGDTADAGDLVTMQTIIKGILSFNLSGRTVDGCNIYYSYNSDNRSSGNEYFDKILLKPGYYSISYRFNESSGERTFSYAIKAEASQNLMNSATGLICSPQSPVVLKTANLTRIFFLDDRIHGWITGNDGIILRTTDAGNTWEYLNIKLYKKGTIWAQMQKAYSQSNLSTDFNTLFFTDSLNGWIGGGSGLLLHTANGGRDWSLVNPGNRMNIRDIYFKDQMEGLLGMENGLNGFPFTGCIAYTRDGGSTWKYFDKTTAYVPDYTIVDLNNIWKDNGKKLTFTDDTCSTWKTRMGSDKVWNNTISINDIFFIDEFHVWVLRYDSLFYTENKGNSWDGCQLARMGIKKVYFSNLSKGFLIGNNGELLITDDRGRSWEAGNTGTFENLTDCMFIENNGWITGSNGCILRTDDYGKSWEYSNILDFVSE
jgi:photosystem II stability/assembly factor-like uncharacterized protein